MVEGTPLLREQAGDRLKSSNLFLSAITKTRESGFFYWRKQKMAKREAFCTQERDSNAGKRRVPACGRCLRPGCRKKAQLFYRKPHRFPSAITKTCGFFDSSVLTNFLTHKPQPVPSKGEGKDHPIQIPVYKESGQGSSEPTDHLPTS